MRRGKAAPHKAPRGEREDLTCLICAMPMELRPLVRRLRLRRSRVGGENAYRGSANGRPVLATATGMGTELAAAGTERLLAAIEAAGIAGTGIAGTGIAGTGIAGTGAAGTGIAGTGAAGTGIAGTGAGRVGRVIVFGIAGAVDDNTALGTIIRPRSVIDAATGTAYTPTPLSRTAETAETVQATPAQAAQSAQDAARGTIWTTDDLITDPGAVAALRARGVVALDMETAAIAAVCERRGLAWSALRVISDQAADGVVTEEVFRLSKQDGSPDMAAVVRYFIRHPSHIRRMARLAASARRATTIAADAAIAMATANDAAGLPQ